MAKEIRLKRLLRRGDVAAVLTAVSDGQDAVVDAKGRRLAGPLVDGPSVPVGDDIFYSISGAMDKMVRANRDNEILKDVVSP